MRTKSLLLFCASLASLVASADGALAASPAVIEIAPGAAHADPHAFVTFGDVVLLAATTATGELALYTTDGTAAGTMQLKTLAVAPAGAPPALASHVMSVVAGAGQIFFAVYDAKPSPVQSLWRSDGTAAGTMMLATLTPGASGSAHYYRATTNGTRGFFARNASTNSTGPHEAIVTTDGTAAGTSVIPSSDGKMGMIPFTSFGGDAYFIATDQSVVHTDGASVSLFASSSQARWAIGACGGDLYIDTASGLTRTTSTLAAGMEVYTHQNPALATNLTCAGKRAVFVPSATNENVPWGSGSAGLAEKLVDERIGTLSSDGTRAVFTTMPSSAPPATSLYATDGTKANTVLLADEASGVQLGVLFALGGVAGHTFVLNDRSSTTLTTIFDIDGKTEKAIALGGLVPTNYRGSAVAGGVLVANDQTSGELWVYDTGLVPTKTKPGADAGPGADGGPGGGDGGAGDPSHGQPPSSRGPDDPGATSDPSASSTSGCNVSTTSAPSGVLVVAAAALALLRRRRAT